MKNYWMGKRFQNEMKRNEDARKKYNECVELYNELTLQNGAHAAISVLSQNRIELSRKCDKLDEEIKVLQNELSAYLTVEDNSDALHSANAIKLSMDKSFVTDYNEIEREFVEKHIKRFCNLTGKERYNWLFTQIENLYKKKTLFERVNLNKELFERIISEVLKNNYPSELEEKTFQKWKEENEEKRGRPLDKSANQEKIKKKVKKLVNRGIKEEDGFKKFWHHEGKHKGKPNKRQLRKRLKKKDLTGKLGDDAIVDRIEKALKEIGIN